MQDTNVVTGPWAGKTNRRRARPDTVRGRRADEVDKAAQALYEGAGRLARARDRVGAEALAASADLLRETADKARAGVV